MSASPVKKKKKIAKANTIQALGNSQQKSELSFPGVSL